MSTNTLNSMRSLATCIFNLEGTWKLLITQMNLFTKQKQTHRHEKQIYDSPRWGGGRDKLGVWD